LPSKGESLNRHYTGIAASLALHAAFFTLVLTLPTAKQLPVYDAIRVHIVEAPSLSAGIHEATPAPVQRILPPKREIRKHVAVVHTSPPEDKTQAVKPAENTVVMNSSGQTDGVFVADAQNGQTGRKADAGAGSGIKPSIVETQFGASGAPSFIHREMPVYPLMARRLGKEGRVILKLLIDVRGTVKTIEIIESAGYGFTEAAMEAVRKSTFAPAHRNGERITARAILPIRFHLK
jgi:TonB family protein